MMEGKDTHSEVEGIFKEKEPRIKKGCSAGRIVNGLIALNYFLVFLTAIIVTGLFGVLDNKLKKHYPDSVQTNRTCILYSHCDGNDTSCDFRYNDSGACDFVAAGFGIVAFVAIVYMVISIVRIVLSTNIWWSAVADIVSNLVLLLVVFVMGITISIGIAVTCTSVGNLYTKLNKPRSCSSSSIPSENGYKFHRNLSAAQGAAWFCFMFLFIDVVVFIVRLCILIRRRATYSAMEDKEVLTAEDRPV